MEFRKICAQELIPSLFDGFHRQQEINACWHKENGLWRIRSAPRIIEDWDQPQREFICWCLQNTLRAGGMVTGAFTDGKLKGIIAVDATPLGSQGQYREIPFLQVSQDSRGQGIGRRLFGMAKAFAKEIGGRQLYISSQPSVETQAFYKALGCREAEEYSPEHVQRGPDDCQLCCDL